MGQPIAGSNPALSAIAHPARARVNQMNDQTSFHGTPVATGRRRRWTTTLLGLGTIAFIGIALAKPWGQPAAAGPGGPSTPVAATGRPATSAPGPAVLPTVAGTLGGPAVAFTLPPPPSPSASWREIRWRRLAPDDPVGLVTAVLRWKDGFIAGDWNVGSTGSPALLWTSRDGSHWDPAPGSDLSYDLLARRERRRRRRGSRRPGRPHDRPGVLWQRALHHPRQPARGVLDLA